MQIGLPQSCQEKKSYSSYSIHLKHLAQAGPDSLKAIPECCLLKASKHSASNWTGYSRCSHILYLYGIGWFCMMQLLLLSMVVYLNLDSRVLFLRNCVDQTHVYRNRVLWKGAWGLRFSKFLNNSNNWNIAAKVVAMSLRIATLLLVSCHHRCCNTQQCLDEPSFMNKK